MYLDLKKSKRSNTHKNLTLIKNYVLKTHKNTHYTSLITMS